MRTFLRLTGVTTLLLTVAACGGAGTAGVSPIAGGGPNPQLLRQGAQYGYASNAVRACPASGKPDIAECLALIRTDAKAVPNILGYTPSDLQSAYNLPSTKDGKGQIIAVVDAYDDPNAASDLATYRSEFGLPACNTSNPCFEKVNEEGKQSNYPQGSPDWGVEESLDVDMASAICPNCTVILVEANSNYLSDLGKSVDTAANVLKANVVSNSYIGYHAHGPVGAKYYIHHGHIIVAAAGDDGYKVGEPAGFPSVVAVGGTSLVHSSGSRGWSETVWQGSGSGCVLDRPRPSWQQNKACKWRTMNDVAAVADPNTGVAVYDSYDEPGWIQIGGTSVASPIIASVYALAGNAAKLDAAESLYASGASLYDVTSGFDGNCKHKLLCNAEKGYDGPTGNGTPNGVSAF